MSSLVWLLIVWGVLTTILIVLLIYRNLRSPDLDQVDRLKG